MTLRALAPLCLAGLLSGAVRAVPPTPPPRVPAFPMKLYRPRRRPPPKDTRR